MRIMQWITIMCILAGCSSTQNANQAPAKPGQLHVVTTMSVLADLIKNVGGEKVYVTNLIPLGAGPEDYQASPGDAQTIAQADLVIFNGHGLEEWLAPLFENAAPEQPRIELSAQMEALEANQPPSADEHNHADGNPHFWLDPQHTMVYVQVIRDQLSAIDPDNAMVYQTNAEDYLQQLEALDSELAALAASLPAERRKLITNHDSFPYFAARYNFEILGVILENPEAELSAGELSTLVETVKQAQVPAIFSESQFSQRTVQLLADETDIQTIGLLYTDTLGTKEAATYIDMMRYNMTTIVKALKN